MAQFITLTLKSSKERAFMKYVLCGLNLRVVLLPSLDRLCVESETFEVIDDFEDVTVQYHRQYYSPNKPDKVRLTILKLRYKTYFSILSDFYHSVYS